MGRTGWSRKELSRVEGMVRGKARSLRLREAAELRGSLIAGSASFATTALPVGKSTITAVYGGDINFGGSTSKAVKRVVQK